MIFKPFRTLLEHVYRSAKFEEDALLLAIRDFCYRLGAWYALFIPQKSESLQEHMSEDPDYPERIMSPFAEPSSEELYSIQELKDQLVEMIRILPGCMNFLKTYRACGMSGTQTAKQIGRSSSLVTKKLSEIRHMIQRYVLTEWQYCCTEDELSHFLEDFLIPAL